MAAPGEESDAELEELLASALEDFERAAPGEPAGGGGGGGGGGGEGGAEPAGEVQGRLLAAQETFFQELFEGELASQASAEFERAMEELAAEEPLLVQQFQKLSAAAGRVGSDAASRQEFTSCLKETLSGLARNADGLQSSGVSEEELSRTMEGLGLEEGDGGEGSLWPIMHSIMQNLLSKDVLYPSLKEITEKYPEWLQRHRDSLPREQFEKYQEQHRVMGRICEQFEAEQPTDGDPQHRARFETILDLMQQLQDLGHPPKELAGESPPGLNFDLEGLNLPDAGGTGGEQCQIM
ncbi:peroxisomal biogenesis factor 19 [Notechis scutatus]|uniref:Peroxisomal biogenesis factor 19 n=1 Tax=Notechis scutatus TaxID=8663 RepID=A0A6J1VEK3_9SAUR|nr:peroxisomal biogenesis factor 19 [Notechis scutatus]